ncbi:MAG6450 family protein [Mycoplasmopsis bovis]
MTFSFQVEAHLGKDQQKFRLFGYFNENNYFVLTKIDSKHNFNE